MIPFVQRTGGRFDGCRGAQLPVAGRLLRCYVYRMQAFDATDEMEDSSWPATIIGVQAASSFAGVPSSARPAWCFHVSANMATAA